MTKLLDLLYQRTHTGNKLHQCNLYDKCFTQNKYLVRHQRTHTVDKTYQCGQCKKCFAKKINLAMHQKTHTGDKPYQCSQFDKAFSTNNMYTCIHVYIKNIDIEKCIFYIICSKYIELINH